MILRLDRVQVNLPPPSDPDPAGAAAVQELLGGKFGEMSTWLNYTFQSFNFRARQSARPFYDLLASIATEEFGHVELVSATINTMLTGASPTDDGRAPGNAVFRDANEQISTKAREHGASEDQTVPFLCECADERCTTILQLTLSEYELVRTDSRQFMTAIAHERAEGPVEIVLRNHTYLVVRKHGRTGELAKELDARRDGDPRP
jgi:hypothetical protein